MARISDPPELWQRFWDDPCPETQAAVAEHYVSVAYVIAGDFGKRYRRQPREFWAVAWEALYGRVPKWKMGDAPFANFAAIRVRGAIMDEIGAHGWHRHQGGENICHERDEGYLTQAPTDGGDVTPEMIGALGTLLEGSDVTTNDMGIYLELTVGRQSADAVAKRLRRPSSWVDARKSLVKKAIKERVRDRRHAAELLAVE